jgi:hypothetical protein
MNCRRGSVIGSQVWVWLCLVLPGVAIAGFPSTEEYLPAVGRVQGAGNPPSQFYATIWASNLTGASETVTFEFLKQGQANTTPVKFNDVLAPGQTKVYENVVENNFHLTNVLGAARVTSTGEVFVAERIYNQLPGDDIGNTEGLFFAGVPKAFSISLGQTASIQGINQGGSENFRYNFALVETGGGSPTVHVALLDDKGATLGAKDYAMQPYEQIQPNVAELFSGISTTNARIAATVTSGTGSILMAGAQVANESQDPSGFDMSFRTDLLGGSGTAGVTSLNGLTGALLLTAGSGISITPSGSQISIAYTGGGGSGLTSVTHDSSLTGSGTGASPLAIAGGQVVRSLNGLHDAVTLAAGANVTITPSGSMLTIASAGGGGGGGLTLPFSGSTSSGANGVAFSITDTASNGSGILGTSSSGYGTEGIAHGASGFSPTRPSGVWGDSDTGFGVVGSGKGFTGVFGYSNTDIGVVGSSAKNDGVRGLAGSSTGAGVRGTGAGGYGVIGTSDTSHGVVGGTTGANPAAGVIGITSNSGFGVYGSATGTNQGAAIGGDAPSGGKAAHFYGGDVYIDNNLHVTKQIFAGTKDFEIDDPVDPGNRYLFHASVESSEMLDIYSGNVRLDALGRAVVRVPAWMEAENGDFRYQLTAIGGPARDLYVADEVHDGAFRIAGGIAGMKVSWQITGVRKDRWALANPLVVEQQKPEKERGYYLHPELYGLPPTRQVQWAEEHGQ